MRKYLLSLILAIVLLTSCKDPGGLPLTPDLVTVVNAYDLDNNGNSSDIRVDFVVANNINVTEYRVIVVPSSSISFFDESNAISIPEGNFLRVPRQSFTNEYSITRLQSNLFDVNGDLIHNNLSYVIAVLVVGTGNHQLSGFSRAFTLTDQGIYNGNYVGSIDWKFIDFVGTDTANCLEDDFIAAISISISEGQQDNYSGRVICSFCDDLFRDQGEISFMISNNIISNLKFFQSIPCYQIGGASQCAICVIRVDPCPGIFTGQGIIMDELDLEIDFSGKDCYASWERKISVTRL